MKPLVVKDLFKELVKPASELSDARRMGLVGVVEHRILALLQAVWYVEQNLIAICLYEELRKAQHALARWRPNTSFHLQCAALNWSELIERRKIMKEGVARAKLSRSTPEPEPSSAS